MSALSVLAAVSVAPLGGVGGDAGRAVEAASVRAMAHALLVRSLDAAHMTLPYASCSAHLETLAALVAACVGDAREEVRATALRCAPEWTECGLDAWGAAAVAAARLAARVSNN